MLSNNAWHNVDDIQSDVERRLIENKVPRTNPLPLARYFHVADTVFNHGAESVKKNELDRAYYFHYFYVNLVVKVLSKHPKYDPNLDMCVEAKKKCVSLLDTLPPLKERLKALYEQQSIRTSASAQPQQSSRRAVAHTDELGLPSVPTCEPGEDAPVPVSSSATPPRSTHSATAVLSHNHTSHAHSHAHGGGVAAPLPELKLPLLVALTELPKNVQYQETQCCATIYPTGRMIRSNLTIVKPRPEPLSLSVPTLLPPSMPVLSTPSGVALGFPPMAPPPVMSHSAPVARVATPDPPPSFTGDSPHTTPVPASVTSLTSTSSTSSSTSTPTSATTCAPIAQQQQSVSTPSSVTSTPASATSVTVPVSSAGASAHPTATASPAVTGSSSAMAHAPTTPAPLPMPSALAPPLPTNVTKRVNAPVTAAPVVNVPPAIRKAKRVVGEGLRPMVLYAPMFVDFMAAAERNTRWAVETCGILAGVESDDGTIFITHLIIPKQIGKSDSVVTTHEEEVLMFQEQHGLLTFGWIHTHPTHDLFMSSVDLHTHYSYQSMTREAIAIVIAPLRSPNFGIFRLTEPDGMQEIGSCQARGFHPHSGRETLYKVCEHTQLEWGDQHRARYKVVDQRTT